MYGNGWGKRARRPPAHKCLTESYLHIKTYSTESLLRFA